MTKINLFAKSFLMMACMAVTFTSCPDDDEDESNSNDGSKKEEKKNQDSNKDENPKNDSGEKENGDEENEQTPKQEVSINGIISGHTYVDLGLPSGLKWATYNVGAEKPEEFGSYFGWGEVSQQEDFQLDNYSMNAGYRGWDPQFSKYVENSANGTPDSLTVLQLVDDAAAHNWGGTWRMPTVDDFAEMVENCTWEWTDNFNGTEKEGAVGTSKRNGNIIFLLATGHCKGKNPSQKNGECNYWTSSLALGKESRMACVYSLSIESEACYHGSRFIGHTVRAVSK